MKMLKLFAIFAALFIAGTLQGQISFNLHFGSPPQWGPADQPAARYYYLPDIEAYYDLQTSMFIYQNRGVWVRRAYLPPHHRHYDLYHGHKVVITNYRGNTPYTNFREYRTRYPRNYHWQPQKSIREKQGRDNPHRNMRPVKIVKIVKRRGPGPDNHRGGGPGNDKNDHGHDHGHGR